MRGASAGSARARSGEVGISHRHFHACGASGGVAGVAVVRRADSRPWHRTVTGRASPGGARHPGCDRTDARSGGAPPAGAAANFNARWRHAARRHLRPAFRRRAGRRRHPGGLRGCAAPAGREHLARRAAFLVAPARGVEARHCVCLDRPARGSGLDGSRRHPRGGNVLALAALASVLQRRRGGLGARIVGRLAGAGTEAVGAAPSDVDRCRGSRRLHGGCGPIRPRRAPGLAGRAPRRAVHGPPCPGAGDLPIARRVCN